MDIMNKVILVICPQLQEYGELHWQEDSSYTFFLSNVSTRGLEVRYSLDRLHVSVLVASAPAEWELAFQIFDLASEGRNLVIESDWEPASFRLHDIRSIFNDGRIQEILDTQLKNIFANISRSGETIVLPGPIWDFHVGPLMLSQRLAPFDDKKLPEDVVRETFLSMMRLVNYYGVMPYFESYDSPKLWTRKQSDGNESLFAEIKPGQSYIVPKVDFLSFKGRGNREVTLPAAFIRETLGEFLQNADDLMWFDEWMFAIKGLSEDRYTQLVSSIESTTNERGFGAKLKLFSTNIFELFK